MIYDQSDSLLKFGNDIKNNILSTNKDVIHLLRKILEKENILINIQILIVTVHGSIIDSIKPNDELVTQYDDAKSPESYNIVADLADDIDYFLATIKENHVRYEINEENFRHLANIIEPVLQKLEIYQERLDQKT